MILSSGVTCNCCGNTMRDYIDNIVDNSSECCTISLSKVYEFAKLSAENREFLATYKGFVPAFVEILSNASDVELIGFIMEVLNLLISEDGRVKKQLHDLIFRNNKDCLSLFILLLEKGNLNSKINSAKLLESIASTMNSQTTMFENQALLTGLYKLVSSKTNQTARAVGLSSLIAVSQSRNVKTKLVHLGIVRTGGKILSDPGTEVQVIEKVMKVLEMVSRCPEGRTAICIDERCLKAIVTRLMNVSVTATEHGIGVLWSLCYLSGDRMAKEAVSKSNGMRKVVLVMQSKCSGSVRQMCGDLVKVFQVNSKSWLTSYETRTTRVR
ncbi:U-box domain-containing protein 28-like [Apium graveolens]